MGDGEKPLGFLLRKMTLLAENLVLLGTARRVQG